MISFDSASGKDSLPASRSQMINVLTAEKKRIEELEKQVKSLLNQRILLLGAAVIRLGSCRSSVNDAIIS